MEPSDAVKIDEVAVNIGMYDDSAPTAERLGSPDKGAGALIDSHGKANVTVSGVNGTRMSGDLDGMVDRVGGGRDCHGGSV